MTREEARNELVLWRNRNSNNGYHYKFVEALTIAIEALEQEPRKDEVILTKKEYGELVSSEFDNGYAKGYREVLEQNDVLDKIRAEIEQLPTNTKTNWDGCCPDIDYPEIEYVDVTKKQLLYIIDKYRAESEE